MADVAYEATGKTLEKLFESSARALMHSMVANLDSIESSTSMKFSLKADNEEKLLHDFLDEIVYYKDAENLFFNEYVLKIRKEEDGYHLEAILKGEKIDQRKHKISVDVKAVSWHKYKVEERKEGWKCFVILDV